MHTPLRAPVCPTECYPARAVALSGHIAGVRPTHAAARHEPAGGAVLSDVGVARRLRCALERGHVLARRGAEQPPVLPAELRRALVADTERGLSLPGVEGCRPRPVGG